jgi:Xaa-Pro aminopeptidase
MGYPEEILTESVSTAELERRWKETRKRMKEEEIDFLVMQCNNEWMGGYLRWFIDLPARNAYPMTIIFPVDEEMTTISSGGRPPADLGPPPWAMRGVKRRLTAPYFRSLMYTDAYDADLAAEVLRSKGKGTIGIVGKGMMSAAFYEQLREKLPEGRFIAATNLVDQIKAVKSDEEIALIRKTMAIHDAAMDYAKQIIRPGRKDFEVIADVVHKVTQLGSEEQLVMGGSGPAGAQVHIRYRRFQNRKIREGDQFNLMIEVNGPGGMYAELGRIFCIGKVSPELKETFEMVKEAQKVALRLLKPGADPAEISKIYNEFLIKNRFPPETRIFGHGQGYDLLERPAIREDEPMKIKAGMHIAIHPIISLPTVLAWLSDNYLITESGVSDCLEKTPQEIFEV